jgi:hypothetical protein
MQFQADITLLQAALAAPAAAAAATVVFADFPQTIGVDDIIDYLKKVGKDIYEKGCYALDDKALTDGFIMTPNKTVVFVEAFKQKAKSMGWSTGTKQITTFVNSSGVSIDIIKNYGQIDLVTNPPPAPGSLFLGVASCSVPGRDLTRVPKPNSNIWETHE